jgi:hypothetical protein
LLTEAPTEFTQLRTILHNFLQAQLPKKQAAKLPENKTEEIVAQKQNESYKPKN